MHTGSRSTDASTYTRRTGQHSSQLQTFGSTFKLGMRVCAALYVCTQDTQVGAAHSHARPPLSPSLPTLQHMHAPTHASIQQQG